MLLRKIYCKESRNSSTIHLIKEKWLILQQFTAIKTKEKIRIKLFSSSPKDTSVARVWIAKLNQEKDNLPNKVYVCSDHFEDDCFDSSWMPQSTLTYSDRPIQRCLCPGEIPTKFPHKPVKELYFSKQRDETHHKKEVCFSYSSGSIN